MARSRRATTNGNGQARASRRSAATYKSERAAIVSFLDKVRAGEANGGEAFAAWAEVCTTDCIRTGIRMVAEREAYHSRIFAQRLAELGGEARATTTEEGRKFNRLPGQPVDSRQRKAAELHQAASASPRMRSSRFASSPRLLKEDLSTKEALRLFAEDELSTAKWIWDCMRRAQRAEAGQRPHQHHHRCSSFASD